MTDGSDLRRFAGTLTAALALVALASSCASGQRPETGGVEPGTYLARFSGQWTLDRNASDVPARALEAHGQEGGRGGGHGAGHGGGRSGGHGAGGHRGGGGGGPDPAALEATFEVFRAVPDHFTLTVTDSLVVTTWAGEREVRMPVAGDAFPISVQGRRIEAKANWDGGRLRLERRIEGGGTIVDLVETLAEGDRLLVIRTVKGVPRTIPEIRLAFDRVRSQSSK
jgi:hypothetical protein